MRNSMRVEVASGRSGVQAGEQKTEQTNGGGWRIGLIGKPRVDEYVGRRIVEPEFSEWTQ